MSKPIRFNPQKLAKLNKMALTNGMVESFDNDNLIRSHLKPSRAHLLKNGGPSKVLKSMNKGGSTSRNLQTLENQTHYSIPRLKENYLLNTSRPNLRPVPSDLYYGSLNSSFDLNETARNGGFLVPMPNVNESVLSMQRKVNDLKELLADRESQLDWVKRTLKYTEINELKQENELLYSECKRLKRYVNILWSKLSEIETTTEIDTLNQIENNITDPLLKQNFTKKRSTIESLLEENNKMNTELENARKENLELKMKLEEGGRRKSAIRFSIDNNDNTKNTSGVKKGIRKGESKIVRQKTGYISKQSDKIISDSK